MFCLKKFIVMYIFITTLFSLHCKISLFNGGDNGEDDTGEEGGLVYVQCTNSQVDRTVWYVKQDGDDNAQGTSEAAAFQTLEKAFGSVRPGGTIRVLPGFYIAGLYIMNCGKGADSILVMGYKGIPTLHGVNEKAIGLFFEGCENIIFDSLQIQNFTDIGIAVSVCDQITLRNLIVRDNGFAVQLKGWELEGYGIHVEDSKNILIENNVAQHNGPDPQIFPDYLMGTGINTYNNKNVIIRNNESFQNIGGGILVEDSENVLVENNNVHDNDCDASADEWWDAGLWVDGGHDVVVRGNVFRNNLGPGIEISDEDDQDPYGYVLEDNISTENYYGIFIWNFGANDWPDTTIIKKSGNQFTGNTRQDVWIVDAY